MIIDAHVHLRHGDRLRTEYTPDDIVRVMDALDIAKSVVFAICCTTRRSIEFAAAARQAFPDRLIPYVYAIPDCREPVLESLRHSIRELGFAGIKVHGGETSLDEWVVDPIVELAGELKAPCLVDFVGHADHAVRLANKYPDANLIVAHMGKGKSTDVGLLEQFIVAAENYGNVYLDVSYMVTYWKIEDAARRIGANRLIWGSDGPHKTPDTVSYTRLSMDSVRTLNLTTAEKDTILGGTIAALLELC